MRLPDGAQLGYCTNVHAGESASEVVDSLRRVAVRVREHLGVGSLGLGLYLSHRAASEVEPRKLRDELAGLGLYAFTFNEIGRASWRERGEISVVAGSF